MLRHLPDFAARPTATGYIMSPSAAPRAGVIRCVERVRPLRRVTDLVRVRLEPPFVEESRSAIEPLVTEEGEYAARLTVTGRQGARWVQREFGFVFGDDFAVVLDATCFDRQAAELFAATTTTLVRGVTLGMPLRRRRFRYTAPADRVPFVRNLETDWIGEADTLTVFPAERSELSQLASYARRGGYTLFEPAPEDVIVATTDTRWRALAGVVDAGWLYFMELSARVPRPIEPLLTCLHSRVALPSRNAVAPTPFEIHR